MIRSNRVLALFMVAFLGSGMGVVIGSADAQIEVRNIKAASVPGKHQHGAGEKCSVAFDFEHRDSLPQTDTPKAKWNTKWGPQANVYPPLSVPECIDNPAEFRQRRIVAVAMKYVGLPYKHKHVPAAGGLDCSNFTSWVYNYGLGVRFTSSVRKQAKTAGRRLGPGEAFQPGDLLFQTDKSGTHISHVVIYIGEGEIIDSTKGKVGVRKLKGWYQSRLSHARRIID